METKRVDLIVIRSIQPVVLTFFTFAVFLYYGFAALIPMAIWVQMSAALSGVFGDIIGTTLGIVALCAAGFYIAKIPGLVDALLGIGMDIGKLAAASVKRVGQLAESVKNDEEPKDVTIEVSLKDQHSA